MSFSQGQPNGNGTVQRPRKIGLWGATSSGKTAFLAALFVAVNQNRDRWKIVGADRTSVNFLANQTDTLTRLRRFPDKTEGIQQLSWTLIGMTEQEAGGRLRRRTVEVPLYIQLDLIDSAGSLFKGEDQDATSVEQNIELGFDDDPDEEGFGVGVGFDQLVD
jgi:ATPase subunit of ABC transporter with duplicated ATPase domains